LPNRPLRLAFVKTPAWHQGDEAMRSAFERLAAENSAIIDEVPLPSAFDDTGGLQRAVQFHDIAENYGPIVAKHDDVMSNKLQEVIAEGRSVTDDEYRKARDRREPLYAAIEPIFAAYDAILTPSAQGIAPEGLSSTGSPMFNFLWTYLGVPAISVPLLAVDGLPLGVQLVGRRHGDAHLLAVAEAAMEALAPS
jgi:Asp-tRNA(Asn)/Glu-tRNA(Gln) amidotransferase A subunit family amidase